MVTWACDESSQLYSIYIMVIKGIMQPRDFTDVPD